MSLDKAFLAKKIISADGPKQDEVNHNASLEEWCRTCIEPEEESNRRRSVLERIHNIVRVWVRHTMITEFRMPESAAAQVEGRIFATGSYRYNVHTSGSDIDMVLIAPSRITRDHFFTTLATRLKNEPWVANLHCITESRVPIIAMVCDGVDIDLSFGSIRQDRVPEVITDDLLQGLDEQSVLSCNAVRVAHNIMDLVPSKATFRQTLRFVKAWGKARLVYSNTFGFPSGIGWAILTAFVCQCYPKQNAAGMVARFFRTYHKWFEPNPHETGRENRAIYLTESMRGKTHLGHSWDPRESKSDAMALFPVLTPALPYGNACYNVTLTNLRQLCDEFKRGDDIVGSSLTMSPGEARAEFGTYGVWSRLLEERPFFGEYRYYMHIQIACTDPEHYPAYADGVESRMRILWAGNASSRGNTLEDYKQLRLHLNPRRYEDPQETERRAKATTRATAPRGSTELGRPSATAGGPATYTAHYFIGMTVDATISTAKVDLAPAIRTFHTVIRQLRQYREGVTKLPQVGVVDIAGVPAFVKEAAGYKEPEPTAAADLSREAQQRSGAAAHGGARSEAGSGSAHSTATNPRAATSTSGASSAHPSSSTATHRTASSAAGSTEQGKRARDDNSVLADKARRVEEANNADDGDGDDLEQALGLDF